MINYFLGTENIQRLTKGKAFPVHDESDSPDEVLVSRGTTAPPEASVGDFDAMEAYIEDEEEYDDDNIPANIEEEEELSSDSRLKPTYTWLLLKSGFFGLIVAIGHAIIQLPQFETWPPQKYLLMLGLTVLAIVVLLRSIGTVERSSKSSEEHLKAD